MDYIKKAWFSFFISLNFIVYNFSLSLKIVVTMNLTGTKHTVKPRPEAHMDMILFEVFLKNIHLIPDSTMTLSIINSAVVISVAVESSRCSSKTLQKGSCPYAPLNEVLR